VNRRYIYGVPGTGKSTLAQEAARSADSEFVELDTVRPIAQAKATIQQEPFLYEYTTEAWKKFGPLNYENVVRGLIGIRQAFKPFIEQELAKYSRNVIAEAVFVDPSGSAILITSSDEDLHYNNFFVHRQRNNDADLQFQAARLMQDFLIQEARERGLMTIDNNGSVEDSVAEILTAVAKLVH
jgi:2-phosphoglycerate kinase